MITKIIIFGVLVALILQYILPIAFSPGYNRRAYNHQPGPCRIVPGITTGSEDIHVLQNGLALITSGITFSKMGIGMDPVALTWKGHIYLFDFNNPDANVTELPITGSFDHDDFRPHGISAWEDPTQTTVFVVNHKRQIEAIEVFSFDMEKRSLKYLKSITDPLMTSVNDVVAVGPDSFYFTNDGYNTQYIMRYLEGLMKFPWGNVAFYQMDTGKAQVVVGRGFELNGINMSPDGRYVYVACPVEGAITVYERNSDHSLKAVQVINLGTILDNIYVDSATGDLWVGCQMDVYEMTLHYNDMNQPCSSQVLHIHLTSKQAPYSYEVREAYVDDGRQVSSSSSGAYYKKQLLIGTVAHKLAYCQVQAY